MPKIDPGGTPFTILRKRLKSICKMEHCAPIAPIV